MARNSRSRRRLLLLGTVGGAIVVLAVGAYFGWNLYRDAAVRRAKATGYELFEAGDYSAALKPLGQYVARNKSDVDALRKLADARSRVPLPNSRHLVLAASLYREVLKLSPADRPTLEGLVKIYGSLGHATELSDTAAALLRIDPSNIDAITAQMVIAASRGLWQDALAGANRLVELKPDDYAYRLAILDLMRSSGGPAADRVAKIKSWIAEGEPDGRYQFMLCATYASMDDGAAAKSAAEQAARLGMPDVESLSRLIDLLDAFDMRDETEVAIQRAVSSGIDPVRLALMQVRRHWLTDSFERAQQDLDAVPRTDQDRATEIAQWQVRIADARGDQERADAALRELETIAAGQPDASALSSWIAAVAAMRAVSSQGQTELVPAFSAMQAAIQANPGDPYLRLLAGLLADRAGESDEAIRNYRVAFDGESRRWVTAGVRLANSMLNAGRTEEGFRLARELSLRFRQSVPAYLSFARACSSLAQEGRVPALVDPTIPRGVTGSTILESLYEAMDRQPALLPPLVMAYMAERDDASAQALASKALAESKVSADVLLQLSGLLADERFGALPGELIVAARERGADPTEASLAEIRLLLARGQGERARQLAAAGLASADDPAVEAKFARATAEAAAINGDSDAPAALAEYLRIAVNDEDAAAYVLAEPVSWSDSALIDAAIARIESRIGRESPRWVLADAERVLRFKRTDADAVARATIAVNELLKANPESTAVLVQLSRLLAVAQPPDPVQAAKFLEQAISLRPGRRDLYPELITLLQSSGDYQAASRYLQQYMRVSEGSESESRIAAGLLMSSARYSDAIDAYSQLSARTGAELDAVGLADAQRRAGRIAEAEKTLRAAVAAPGRTIISVMALTELLGRLGRIGEANQVIADDAASPTPALTPANRAFLKAQLALNYGDAKQAGAIVEEAVQLAPDNPAMCALYARYLLAIGDVPGAITAARAGLDKNPDDPQLLQMVAPLLLAESGSDEDTQRVIEQLGKGNPALAEALRILKSCKGPDGALAPGPRQLAEASALTQAYPAFAPVWTITADLYTAAGQLDEAIRVLQQARARLPSEPLPAGQAARLLLEADRLDEAREAARAWRALTMDSPFEPDLLLAKLALIGGKPSESVSILKPYADRLRVGTIESPDAIGILGAALLLQDDVDGAVDLAKLRLPTDAQVREQWFRAARLASTSTALKALERCEDLVTGDELKAAVMAEYLALARRTDGQEAVARAASIAASLSPQTRESPMVRLLLADLDVARGDLARASEGFVAVIDEIPASDRALLRSGSTLSNAEQQRLGPARLALVYACNNLASALAGKKQDLNRAMALIDEAIAAQPDDWVLLDTKAQVLAAQEKLGAARELAERAAGLPEAGAEVQLTLAKISIADGQPEEAARHIENAYKMTRAKPFIDHDLIRRLDELRDSLQQAVVVDDSAQ